MNIQPYRRFQTRRECREWVDRNHSIETVVSDVVVTEVEIYSEDFDRFSYTATGHAWRNPCDAEDATLSIEIAQGRACDALADIIWQADTAQAMHKMQAARRQEQEAGFEEGKP